MRSYHSMTLLNKHDVCFSSKHLLTLLIKMYDRYRKKKKELWKARILQYISPKDGDLIIIWQFLRGSSSFKDMSSYRLKKIERKTYSLFVKRSYLVNIFIILLTSGKEAVFESNDQMNPMEKEFTHSSMMRSQEDGASIGKYFNRDHRLWTRNRNWISLVQDVNSRCGFLHFNFKIMIIYLNLTPPPPKKNNQVYFFKLSIY